MNVRAGYTGNPPHPRTGKTTTFWLKNPFQDEVVTPWSLCCPVSYAVLFPLLG